MEKRTPVRKPHTSTADLLTWSENSPEYSPATAPPTRSHQVMVSISHGILRFPISFLFFLSLKRQIQFQPSDGISKVVFGGQVTDEEVESLNKRLEIQLFSFPLFFLDCFVFSLIFEFIYLIWIKHLMHSFERFDFVFQ